MEYERVYYNDKEEIISLLSGSDVEIKRKVIAGMVFGIKDREWVRDILNEYILHEDYWVANNAIIGIQELVRNNPTVDVTSSILLLKEVRSEDLADTVDDTLEAIKEFKSR